MNRTTEFPGSLLTPEKLAVDPNPLGGEDLDLIAQAARTGTRTGRLPQPIILIERHSATEPAHVQGDSGQHGIGERGREP